MITSSTTKAQSAVTTGKRGAFIVLEGVDRCGKTTQSGLLVKHLISLGIAAMSIRFPERTTAVGSLINQYLQSKSDLNDHAIHLLFSANRWEAVDEMKRKLNSGTTLVCDRYAHSGVAFSSAKTKKISIDWCKKSDIGLLAPDAVIFLDMPPEEAEKRGGYGNERYEKQDMQRRVRQKFEELKIADEGRIPWHIIDAAKSVEDVTSDITVILDKIVEEVADKPLEELWN